MPDSVPSKKSAKIVPAVVASALLLLLGASLTFVGEGPKWWQILSLVACAFASGILLVRALLKETGSTARFARTNEARIDALAAETKSALAKLETVLFDVQQSAVLARQAQGTLEVTHAEAADALKRSADLCSQELDAHSEALGGRVQAELGRALDAFRADLEKQTGAARERHQALRAETETTLNEKQAQILASLRSAGDAWADRSKTMLAQLEAQHQRAEDRRGEQADAMQSLEARLAEAREVADQLAERSAALETKTSTAGLGSPSGRPPQASGAHERRNPVEFDGENAYADLGTAMDHALIC